MDDDDGLSILSPENTQWLEQEVVRGLRLWHVLGIVFFSILGIVILLCCCSRYRIPRTKQEIEADYNRRKIVKKFRKRIQKFENAEMDAEMNLRKDPTISEMPALEKIRADFLKENHKSQDVSSGSENDESNYDEGKADKRKKKLISKKDQLIQTIYTGNYNNLEAPLSLEAGDNSVTKD